MRGHSGTGGCTPGVRGLNRQTEGWVGDGQTVHTAADGSLYHELGGWTDGQTEGRSCGQGRGGGAAGVPPGLSFCCGRSRPRGATGTALIPGHNPLCPRRGQMVPLSGSGGSGDPGEQGAPVWLCSR